MESQFLDPHGSWENIFPISETDSQFYSFTESLLQVYNFIKKETENWNRLGGLAQRHGHEFKQVPGDGEGQGSLCAAVPGVKKLDMTERLNNKKSGRRKCKILNF